MLHVNFIDQSSLRKTTPEASIKIFLNENLIAISQASPRNIEELAIGFLLSEGFMNDRNLFKGVNFDASNNEVYVYTDEVFSLDLQSYKSMTSSGASLRLDSTSKNALLPGKNTSRLRLRADGLHDCMEELCQNSPLRNAGECTHACGLGALKLECVREDIGRHNALDKLFGQAWIDKLPLKKMAVFTTGRISYEVLLKVARAGISVLVSRKGITDSAANLAQELGVSAVAYCKENTMSVYTHPERIIT